MELFPAGIAVLAIFLIAQLRSFQAGFCVAMATLPIGALAVLSVGNFNFLASQLIFLMLIFLASMRFLLSQTANQLPRLEKTGVALLVFTFYAVITSQIFPRLFAGEIWVFSLDGGIEGRRISPLFLSRLSLLQPTSGNVSQPIYLLISTSVFFLTLRLARVYGPRFLDKGFFYAASASALTGLLDFVNLDALLLPFKTAGYTIFIDAKISGVSRIVGAYPEASAMGSFCSIMFAYMMMRYLDSGNRAALLLAGMNFLWTVLALSSTGFVALGFAGIFVLWRSGFKNISRKIAIRASLRFLLLFILAISCALIILMTTSFGNVVWSFLNELIFQKGTSLSALERGVWASRGMAIARETYGLGAGFGSTRSNGLIASVLSNIGVFGLLMYAYFVWLVLRIPKFQTPTADSKVFYNAASIALLTSLAAKLVSGTSADPGILFLILAAIAVSSRPPQYFQRRLPRRGQIISKN